MIKVLLERRVKRKNYSKLIANLTDLRAACLRQSGYITGETLIRGYDPIDVLVISTWISEGYWKAWMTKEERITLNDLINPLIDGEEKISIYKMASDKADA